MEYIDNLPAMDLMSSEKMTFVQLIIPVESAYRAISYLGQLGLLQFRDEEEVCYLHNLGEKSVNQQTPAAIAIVDMQTSFYAQPKFRPAQQLHSI